MDPLQFSFFNLESRTDADGNVEPHGTFDLVGLAFNLQGRRRQRCLRFDHGPCQGFFDDFIGKHDLPAGGDGVGDGLAIRVHDFAQIAGQVQFRSASFHEFALRIINLSSEIQVLVGPGEVGRHPQVDPAVILIPEGGLYVRDLIDTAIGQIVRRIEDEVIPFLESQFIGDHHVEPRGFDGLAVASHRTSVFVDDIILTFFDDRHLPKQFGSHHIGVVGQHRGILSGHIVPVGDVADRIDDAAVEGRPPDGAGGAAHVLSFFCHERNL